MTDSGHLITQFDFALPRGLIDVSGSVHCQGVMRLATARDELVVRRDRRVQVNESYSTLMMLSQVITQLGSLEQLSPEDLENLFTQDLAYLREFFNRINKQGSAQISTACPHCETEFSVELVLAGEP